MTYDQRGLGCTLIDDGTAACGLSDYVDDVLAAHDAREVRATIAADTIVIGA